jgi:mannonate dehydratase
MPHQEGVNEVFQIPYHYEKGYLHLQDLPGLGVDLNEKAAGKYPYQRAFLPVNRKTDGTLFHW